MGVITAIYNTLHDDIRLEEQQMLVNEIRSNADTIRLWSDERVCFSCHHQWITPESINEILPYFDRHRRLAITADAIIDNREDLFDELGIKKRDWSFIADSKLIILAFEKWGERVAEKLIGDFAFLIWDGRKNRLFGARDFSGSRTLYYYRDQERLTFCSLLKPLAQLTHNRRKLNQDWLTEFLTLSTTLDSTNIHETVYKDVFQVPPSHTVLVDHTGITLTRYQALSKVEPIKLRTNEEYVDAFKMVFTKAITSRLRTTKKVGAHLSGGLDSSAVASYAAKELERKKQSLFTYSYAPVPDYQSNLPESLIADESTMIQEIVQFSRNMKPQFLNEESINPYTELDDCLQTLEMPYKYHLNAYWLHHIYKLAKAEGVQMMLNGFRGNWTISYGDALEYQMRLFKKLKWLMMIREIDSYSKRVGIRRLAILGELKHKWQHRQQKVSLIEKSLVHPDFVQKTNVMDRLNHFQERYNQMQTAEKLRQFHFEQLSYWNRTNTFSAKVSYRYQVADRDPTNDLRVVRFCLALPYDQFIQDGLDRALIRKATHGYLPDSIRLNQKVRGVQGNDSVFRMRKHKTAFLNDLKWMLEDSLAQSIFNIPFLKDCLQTFESDRIHLFTNEYDTLMKVFIVYRFLSKHA